MIILPLICSFRFYFLILSFLMTFLKVFVTHFWVIEVFLLLLLIFFTSGFVKNAPEVVPAGMRRFVGESVRFFCSTEAETTTVIWYHNSTRLQSSASYATYESYLEIRLVKNTILYLEIMLKYFKKRFRTRILLDS